MRLVCLTGNFSHSDNFLMFKFLSGLLNYILRIKECLIPQGSNEELTSPLRVCDDAREKKKK